MSKLFTVTRGLAIVTSLSLLPATKLPTTSPKGQTVACLASIVCDLKSGDDILWLDVLPMTMIETWIRKVTSRGV